MYPCNQVFVPSQFLVSWSELNVGVVSSVSLSSKTTQCHECPVWCIHRQQQLPQAIFFRSFMNEFNQLWATDKIDPAIIPVAIYRDLSRLEWPDLVACRVVIHFHFGHTDLHIFVRADIGATPVLGLAGEGLGKSLHEGWRLLSRRVSAYLGFVQAAIICQSIGNLRTLVANENSLL